MIDDILAKFDGAFAQNTIRAYRADFIQFELWCKAHGKSALPTDAETLAAHVTDMASSKKSATIRRRINSLCTIFKLSGNPNPTSSPEVLLALKRMHRKIGRHQHQATPLTQSVMEKLLTVCDETNRGLRNRVLLLLGHETMRRRSELCNFRFEDVGLTPLGQPYIWMRFSKTDQFGVGKKIPISETLNQLIQTWQNRVGTPEGYILRSVDRDQRIGEKLEPHSINYNLQKLQAAALPEKQLSDFRLSGHSFRVGTAIDLLTSGTPMEKIMLKGGWKTESTALRYLREWNEI